MPVRVTALAELAIETTSPGDPGDGFITSPSDAANSDSDIRPLTVLSGFVYGSVVSVAPKIAERTRGGGAKIVLNPSDDVVHNHRRPGGGWPRVGPSRCV